MEFETTPQVNPRVKRRKLNYYERLPNIDLSSIQRRLVERQESFNTQEMRIARCWVDAKKGVNDEFKRRLQELKELQMSSLKNVDTLHQRCTVKLQKTKEQLQHDTIIVKSHQELKLKSVECNVLDLLGTLEPLKTLIKRSSNPLVLDLLPNVTFHGGGEKLEVKIELSGMRLGGLRELIEEVEHRCFSPGVVGLVTSYTNTPVDFKGKCCFELNVSQVNCVVGLTGGRLATGNNYGPVHIWDSQSGKQLSKFNMYTTGVLSLAVVSDNRLLSTLWDKTLCLWNIQTGRQIRVFRGHTAISKSVCTFTDSKGVLRATSGSVDKTIRVWDLDTGACIRVLRGHTDWVSSITVSTDGSQRLVSGSANGAIRVWDIETGECLRVRNGHTNWVNSVIILNDQKRAVSASSDKTLCVWNIETGECLRVLKGHTKRIESVSAFRDGQHIISGSEDGTMRVWNVDTGECLKVVKVDSSVRQVCCLEDGRVVSIKEDKFQVWE